MWPGKSYSDHVVTQPFWCFVINVRRQENLIQVFWYNCQVQYQNDNHQNIFHNFKFQFSNIKFRYSNCNKLSYNVEVETCLSACFLFCLFFSIGFPITSTIPLHLCINDVSYHCSWHNPLINSDVIVDTVNPV